MVRISGGIASGVGKRRFIRAMMRRRNPGGEVQSGRAPHYQLLFDTILSRANRQHAAMSVRQSYVLTFCAIVGSSLAACTTMPPPSEMPAANFVNVLHLCAGDHIDNAPPTDHKRHILGYDPLARVAGVAVWRAPVRRACFSSGFGRRHDRSGRHNGIDLSTGHAHEVYAGGDGVVEEMRVANGYGRMVLIRHNSRVQTRYGHLSAYASDLHVGHDVRMGEVIGRTGRTGNATAVILHYEIIVDGVPRDPMTVE